MTIDKYFTPSIEDIRVGYECEVFRERDNTWWSTSTIGRQSVDWIIEKIDKDKIRVPYLTKEQIEAEGWERSKNSMNITTVPENYEFLVYLKSSYVLSYVREKNLLEIQKKKDDLQWYIFQGECKDINTFRYISKLLGI